MTRARANVLVFPAGAENALEIHAALRHSLHFRVFGGSSVDDHARFAYEHYVGGMPHLSEPDFIEGLNDTLQRLDIRVIFPTHDTVAVFMAEHRDRIRAGVIVADARTARICREKRLTFDLFRGTPFCPAIYADANAIPCFPVFVKPNIGEGGRGAGLVNDAAELAARPGDLVICEYLPGEEYTVDCFTDRHGALRFAGPRSRDRVRAGISVASRSRDLTPDIAGIAETINAALGFRGLWFFQLKRATDGTFKLLEVSSRAAGTMALYRQLGVNFPLLSAFDALGQDITILPNPIGIELDRCLHNRYRIDHAFDTVYIDYDDTIVGEGIVNDLVLRFLYQCANRGVHLVLITRHDGDLLAHMRQHKIAPELFDEIMHIEATAKKSTFITRRDAVFVDNHFPERQDVASRCGIPVFDVDAVECLIRG